MPSIAAGRITPGSGSITFSTSSTATAGIVSAPATAAASSNTTLTVAPIPSTGIALFDSLSQSTTTNNNITLALRNLIGGSNISVSSANGVITIATTMVLGPTGPTGPSGGATGPIGPTGPTGTSSTPVTVVATSGATQTVTFPTTGHNVFDITLTANCTITLVGGTGTNQYQTLTLILRQNVTAGWTATLPGGIKWPSSVAPILNTVAGRLDAFNFSTPDAGTTIIGKY